MRSHSEFDKHARDYELLHDDNVALVGAESSEFLHAKLRFCARFATNHFRSGSSARTFLDYGCGTGRLGAAFHDYFDVTWNYVGVDPSEACIGEARKKLGGARRDGTPRFQTLDGWNNVEDKYDFVLAACVFHHIAPDQRPLVFRQIWNRLKSRGVVMIWEHNPWNPVTRKIVRSCVFDRDAVLLSIKEMGRMWRKLDTPGQTGGRFVTFFPGPLRRLEPLERALGWLLLGGQWLFWAKKLVVA